MRWAVVTGAGSGIGAALALSLLRASIGVVAVGRRADKLNELRACVLSEESEAVAQDMLSRLKTVAADVASAAGQQAVAAALPADEPLNFLVNNAGVGVPDKIENVSRQHFEDALAVNVTGPLFLTQLLLPRLRLCGGEGRVLNIGSGIADRVQTGTGTYGVTKKALHRLTLQMAAELADDDRGPEARVWVGYARPGVVDTEGLRAHVEDAAAKGLPHADWLARTLQQGDNADAAQVGAFLSRLLTGGTGHAFMTREWIVNQHTLRDNPDPWG